MSTPEPNWTTGEVAIDTDAAEVAVDLAPAKPTADGIYDSLNYFDEIAVKAAFGEELLALKKRPNAFMRALIFSDLRTKAGLKDRAAQDRVFSMLNGEVQDWFHVEPTPAKCINESCPCAEHVKDEDDDEDPTQPLS